MNQDWQDSYEDPMWELQNYTITWWTVTDQGDPYYPPKVKEKEKE